MHTCRGGPTHLRFSRVSTACSLCTSSRAKFSGSGTDGNGSSCSFSFCLAVGASADKAMPLSSVLHVTDLKWPCSRWDSSPKTKVTGLGLREARERKFSKRGLGSPSIRSKPPAALSLLPKLWSLKRLLRDLEITGSPRGAFTLLGPDFIYQISL